MLQDIIISFANDLFSGEGCSFQHDGASLRYHTSVRCVFDAQFSGRWWGRRGSLEYPPRSPDLTPLDFYHWGKFKE